MCWTKNREVRRELRARQDTWPLSFLEVQVAQSVLAETSWASQIRCQLLADAAWVEEELCCAFSCVVRGVPVHYRFCFLDRAAEIAAAFLQQGIAVRLFGCAHGVIPGGLRITAPKVDERRRFKEALCSIVDL